MRTPLDTWMRQRGGVAHSSDLRTAGYSAHEMRSAVEAGRAERVRRSWLVTPQCSRAHRAAAEVSGRVTCVTAAKRLGLWSTDDPRVHLAIPSTSSRIGDHDHVLHWAPGPAPVARFAVEDPILNVLYHVGRCQEPSDAAAIWESALRIGLVTLPQLRRTQWRSTAVQNVLDVVGTLSDSGVETRFLAIARSCGVDVQQQVIIDGHPVDALIGERLVVQLDGFTHHRKPKDRRRDLRQDARLALLGYTVLRFDYQQVMFDPTYVQQTIINAVAQGLHRARR
ncbi:endonuclease domain-containing protein [Microbacterium esteraromaticum]|uniref:endonuclease domain-containing protein n=1 Tax=Microbacterium esteraromaticum TaxID=57043 RepID=UPI001C968419|nr:DUF559 domain-containing protein [Microbacterium esteraromaticum]MBY6060369.1 endonuclease domain-containing protein [Microbacterium esteraromaticum]